MGLDEVYKLHYYSQVTRDESDHGIESDGVTVDDCELFRFGPCNLYQEEEKREQIKAYLKLLAQFNVFLELGIEGSYC